VAADFAASTADAEGTLEAIGSVAGCDRSKFVSQMDGYILKAGFMCAQFFGTIPE
jgi:hypothetical protein